MTVGATLIASLLTVLERPSTWPLGLLAFLVRGGLLVIVAPIVVLPTAVGLANVLAPILAAALVSGLTPTVLVALIVVLVLGVVWLLGGGLLAAAAEAEAIDRTTEGLVDGRPARGGTAWRILVARMAAYVPLLVALSWGSTRVVASIYREFTVPVDTVTPLVLRVARTVPDALAVIVVAWLLGEVVGGLAARRIVLRGESPFRALRVAVRDVIRRPVRTLLQLLVPLLVLAAVLVPSAAAAAAAWTAIRATLVDGLPPLLTLIAVLVLVVVWAGQLVLLGLVAAWRGAVWTLDVAGTFGGGSAIREGGWWTGSTSVSLGDPSGSGSRPGSEGDP